MKHDGRKRDIAADGHIVFIADGLGCKDIHIFVHRNRIRRGAAHHLDIAGGIAAHKKGRERLFFFTQIAEQFSVGCGEEFFKVIRRDLRDQRVHYGDHIHTCVQIKIAHALGTVRTEAQQVLHIVLVVEHIHEDIIAAQMAGQCERPAQQPIKGGGISHGLFHATHGRKHHGHASAFGCGKRAAARHRHRVGQRMRRNGGRAVVGPHQPAAQYLGL